MDVAGLQVPTEAVKGVCIEDVVWLRDTSDSSDASTPKPLRLNATLRWRYPPQLWRHFRLYWQRLRGPSPTRPIWLHGTCGTSLLHPVPRDRAGGTRAPGPAGAGGGARCKGRVPCPRQSLGTA